MADEGDSCNKFSLDDQDFLGVEGKELLTVLDDVESSAKQTLPMPNWLKDLPFLDESGLGVKQKDTKFKPFLKPLDEDLEFKLRKWTKNERFLVSGVIFYCHII